MARRTPERKRRGELVDSLERLTSRSIHGTLAHAPLPVRDLDGLWHRYPDDLHPSTGGHFYARTVLEILRRNGHLG